MNAAEIVSRDKQVNFRVSAEEMDRFERVAARYGLTVSAAIRMVMKERDDDMRAESDARESRDDFTWKDHHNYVLKAIATDPDGSPMSAEEVWQALDEVCVNRARESPPNLGRALNQLRRNGYVRRMVSGYVLTDKGLALTGRGRR
jgi:hypothetical protein